MLILAAVVHVAFAWLLSLYRGWRARCPVPETAGEADRPPVSILVPAWQERGTAERCITSLRRLRYPRWEAVIIAGGSDGTYEATLRATAGDDRFRVLEQRPLGKNAALMQGVVAARHEVLAFLDADSEVGPDWLSLLVAPLVAGASASAGTYVPRRATWASLTEQMEKIEAEDILGSRSLQGSGSVAIGRAVLERIDGLPLDVRVGVDWDLGMRLARLGEPVARAPRAAVTTERPATLGEFWANEVRWRRAHLRGLWRHKDALLKSPLQVASGLYFYLLSVLVVVGLPISLLVALLRPRRRPAVGQLTLALAIWLLGRRAALGAEITAYTGDPKWLGFAWAPAALLVPAMAASVVALLTVGRGQQWFKGPR